MLQPAEIQTPVMIEKPEYVTVNTLHAWRNRTDLTSCIVEKCNKRNCIEKSCNEAWYAKEKNLQSEEYKSTCLSYKT